MPAQNSGQGINSSSESNKPPFGKQVGSLILKLKAKAKPIRKNAGSFISLAVLILGLLSGIVLVQQYQEFRSRAARKNPQSPRQAETSQLYSYDVVVVGGGTSGVTAAIQAGRMGRVSVALLEETDWIGGQMTAAAVSTIDEGAFLKEGGRSGIYKEFIDKVKNHYGSKPINTCYWNGYNSICFEPSVGKQILEEMLSQAGVDLHLRQRVTEVTRNGNQITSVRTQSGNIYSGKVFVEATEYGDLLELSSARYRAGNSTSENLNTSSCVQHITYPAVMKYYPGGVPGELDMTRISTPPGGWNSYNFVKDNFEKYVKADGHNSWDEETPVTWRIHNAYRGLPDSSNSNNYTADQPSQITKTVINWANDYPYRVSDLSQSNRKNTNCQAKLLTLQFMWYVQNDLGQKNWAVANDEGFNTTYNIEENSCSISGYQEIEKYMPPIPYVREARRGMGKNTLTSKNIRRASNDPKWRAVTSYSDSLAVGDYPADFHGCSTPSTLESIDSSQDLDSTLRRRSGPYQIPFGSFIHESIENLILAEKNISVSRIANSAIRTQPTTMAIGQAAGVLARISALNDIIPGNLNVRNQQKAILGAESQIYGFSDMSSDQGNFEFIQFMPITGMMSGIGGSWEFQPTRNLTRAEASVVIVRLAGSGACNDCSPPSFEDVSQDHWSYGWIEELNRLGITAGCSTNPPKFCPNDFLTRAQIAVFITRAAGLEQYTGDETPPFDDVSKSDWFYRWVMSAYKAGVMQAVSGNSFEPNRVLTRGEIAEINYKALEYQGRF